jgi:UDP-N-acetylmuramate dehydrogenase
MSDATSIERAFSVLGPRARRDEPIGARTTYRVGGRAALYLEAESEEDLALVVRAVAESGIELLVFGAGSNLLIADTGFPGLCVALGAPFEHIEVGQGIVEAGGAVLYPVLARRLAALGWSGMEWAVGIPGSVGGAVAMNAGGHGEETRARLIDARLFDLRSGATRVADPDGLDLSYRHSNVRREEVVLKARFALSSGDRASCARAIEEIVTWRREHQPGGRNAGSVFANPPGDSAGRLIDAAGLKGLRVGSAVVSDKHANFFVAAKDGSAADVLALIETVRRLVRERCGVDLQPEVRCVGFDRG